MSDITVYIGHVILESGWADLGQGQPLARMTEAALQRLLAYQGFPPGWGQSQGVEIGASHVQLPCGASQEQRAQALALALYQALGKMR
jgi:hypothetical protein